VTETDGLDHGPLIEWIVALANRLWFRRETDHDLYRLEVAP